MIQQRLMLGLMSLGIVLAASGCSANKSTPSAIESSVQQDRAISDAIINKIQKDVALSDDASNFQVLTVKGETTLYGVVDSELERSHAEQIAADAKGVHGVTSRIKLATQAVETAAR